MIHLKAKYLICTACNSTIEQTKEEQSTLCDCGECEELAWCDVVAHKKTKFYDKKCTFDTDLCTECPVRYECWTISKLDSIRSTKIITFDFEDEGIEVDWVSGRTKEAT